MARQAILLCGLNGCGKSTLGKALAAAWGGAFLDAEDYFFPDGIDGAQRSREAVSALLRKDMGAADRCVLASVKGNFSEAVQARITLAVHLVMNREERLRRVYERSQNRFGARMQQGGDLCESERQFLAMVEGRSEDEVESWLRKSALPVLTLDATLAPQENVQRILQYMEGKRMRRIGCVNWDSLLPRETYFGGYTLRALENTPERMPYCAVKGEKGWDIPLRTQEDYDKELQYAIDAGIDYFAHCWYPRRPIENPAYGTSGMDDLAAPICELTLARTLHANSALRDKIKLCAILAPYRVHDEDCEELCDAMEQDWYEKTADGRPLLYVFDFFCDAGVEILAQFAAIAKKRGIAPYIIGMNNSGQGALDARRQRILATVDALCAYAQCSEGIETYEQLISDVIAANAGRASWGKPVVPFYTMGWSPIPRVKSPVPWCGYADTQYAAAPSKEEWIAQAKRFAAWMKENADQCQQEHLLTFAWNEFEEGGWICPTLDADGGVDTSRVRVYNTISHILRR